MGRLLRLGLGHVFTAVMTGNVLFAGFGLVTREEPLVAPVVALGSFAAGAITGHGAHGLLVRWRGERWRGERWPAFAVAGEGLLLLVATLLALALPGSGAAGQAPQRGPAAGGGGRGDRRRRAVPEARTVTARRPSGKSSCPRPSCPGSLPEDHGRRSRWGTSKSLI